MVQIEVYIPNLDRDGNEVPAELYSQALVGFEAILLGSAGGFSQYNVNGAWINRDTGKVMHESTVVYRVLTARDSYAHLAILRWAKDHGALLNQEAVLVTVQDIKAEFVTA